ncbi:uncharacterized protein EHS24_000678 [Apiotrichum porosum]|uniref:Transcription elongation factor Eaf N-terminal domain-containing protein n=1 Tax=Apiotrichum porosum TaxID=105984 RepID=A0A427YAG6_9TREE|nr:uncharacterized protein EHS24_000678 [Apiotrichum porosum]RSH88151.1 hypothetical protein EHS24_000678 [Apiotrichum porosum]
MADPLSSMPNGTYPLRFAPSGANALAGKRARSDDVVAFRYAFKPASVTSSTPGALEPSGSGRVLSFDLPTGGSQVFDVREETSKARECVLVWDEGSQSFVLHALPSTLHLTQNRTLSAQRTAGSSQVSRAATPRQATPADDEDEFEQVDVDVPAPPQPLPPPPPAPATTARARVGGKGIARKALPAGVAAITATEPPAPAKKKKAAPKKAAAAAPKTTKAKAAPKKTTPKKKAAAQQPPASKIKSVEIIEDSDDDMDEFADMLGAAVEQAGATTELPGYDDDDEDEEEEEEDDELGGAQFAGYNRQGAEEDVEWI